MKMKIVTSFLTAQQTIPVMGNPRNFTQAWDVANSTMAFGKKSSPTSSPTGKANSVVYGRDTTNP